MDRFAVVGSIISLQAATTTGKLVYQFPPGCMFFFVVLGEISKYNWGPQLELWNGTIAMTIGQHDYDN